MATVIRTQDAAKALESVDALIEDIKTKDPEPAHTWISIIRIIPKIGAAIAVDLMIEEEIEDDEDGPIPDFWAARVSIRDGLNVRSEDVAIGVGYTRGEVADRLAEDEGTLEEIRAAALRVFGQLFVSPGVAA